jgi:hypothetical protein
LIRHRIVPATYGLGRVEREGARRWPTELQFDVMNAVEASFEDDSCGMLKLGGEAFFLKPLGHNPFINLYRRFTPRFRTLDEHPLVISDFELARRYFGSVDAEFFHVTSFFARVRSKL